MPRNGRSAAIQRRTGSTMPCSRRCRMQSPKAPTPGRMTASQASSSDGWVTMLAGSPRKRHAFVTLPRLPMP